MAIFKQKITNFSGGILEDKRIQSSSHFSITKHFDAFSYLTKLVPFQKTVPTDNENKLFNIVKFVYGNGNFYGLGDKGGDTSKIQVYINQSGIGATDVWATATNGTGLTNNKSTDIFFLYKNYIYMYAGGDRISRFDTAGGVFVDTYIGSGGTLSFAVSYTTSQMQAEPVLHPSDDIAYFFTDNVVSKLDNVTWTGAVLTLPSTLKIVSCTAYGNYLAIGCVTKDGYNTRSIVYLWDRDSSITTLSERIDFGEGAIKHLQTLDNKLIAIMDFYSGDSFGNPKEGRIYIKQANGQVGTILNALTVDATQTIISFATNTRFVRNEILYVPFGVKLNGDNRYGIWAIKSNGSATLAIVEEDLATNQAIQSIYATGKIWWIAHSSDGSIQRTSYVNGAYSSTNPSIYESLILNTIGDSATKKKLLGITIMTEPLPSGAQVLVKYRKNVTTADGTVSAETAWTLISTHSTVDSINHDAVNIETTGANLPQYNEIQFRFESYGGAVITGYEYTGETVDDAPFSP